MVKHPRCVEGYNGTLDQLAEEIVNLSYNQYALLMGMISENTKRDAGKNLANNKNKLSPRLYVAADYLYKVKDEMDGAWKICEPYM